MVYRKKFTPLLSPSPQKAFSGPPPLPSCVWFWLTSGNSFDNKGYGGLPYPKLGNSYFDG